IAIPAMFTPNRTSIFLRAESFCINGLGCWLVTMCGLGPCAPRGDDLWGDREVAIDLLDVGFRRGGLADAQTGAVVGGENDSADLMSFESVTHARPGGMDALVG